MSQRIASVLLLTASLAFATPSRAAPGLVTRGTVLSMEVHAAAGFLARMYGVQILVIGGGTDLLQISLDGLTAEAALQRLADSSGLALRRSDRTFVLLPVELTSRVDGPRRAAPPGRRVSLEFTLVEADNLLRVLGEVLKMQIDGHVAGRLSIYGREFSTLGLAWLITRLAGQEATAKGRTLAVGAALPDAPTPAVWADPSSPDPMAPKLNCVDPSALEVVAWSAMGERTIAAVRTRSAKSDRPLITIVRRGDVVCDASSRIAEIDAPGIKVSNGVKIATARPATDYGKVQLKVQRLGTNVAEIEGRGGNIGVSFGDDGVFLVDAEYAPLNAKLRAAIDTLAHGPVRLVFNTHWHGDHTGGNGPLVGQGAIVVAHDNARRRMTVEQVNTLFKYTEPPAPHRAVPVVTFDEELSFHLNDEDITVFHVPHAHTDGDAVVWFKKANVVHLGDTFFTNGYPYIDVDSGGTIDGYINAADRVLKLADDGTRLIPGHGPVSDKKRLKEWRDMLATIRGKIGKLKAQRKTLEQIQAETPTAEYDAVWGRAFIPPPVLVETIYKSVDGPLPGGSAPGMAPGPAPGGAPRK